jgi:hypothetical protein
MVASIVPSKIHVTSYKGRQLKLNVNSNKGGFGSTANDKPAVKSSKRGKTSSRNTAQPNTIEAAQPQTIRSTPANQQQRPQQFTTTTQAPIDDYDPTAAVPTIVTDRMLKRIIIFAGSPIFFGLTLLPLFYYLKIKHDLDIPTWIVYSIQSLAWGGGLAGISYGIVSTSWEPRREGSFLGWTEFQANLPLVLERFRRNKN